MAKAGTLLEKFKANLLELKNEFVANKKVLILMILICIEEYFFFSIFVTFLPLWATITINVTMISIIAMLFVINIKEKKPSKSELKRFLIFTLFALLFGVLRSYLYIASLLVAYLFYPDKKKMFKWIFLICSSVFILELFLCLIRIIPDNVYIKYNEQDITNIRHTFGYSHPNQPTKFYLTMIISGYLWLCNNKKQTLIFTLCMLPLAIVFGYNTDSRTGFIVNLMVLILLNLPFLVNWIKTKWLYLLFTIITILLILSFALEIHRINWILSGRPYWYNLFITSYPWAIILGKCYGPLITDFANFPLDNSYLFTVFDGSIFALIAINILFYLTFKNNHDKKINVALFSILTYALTESLCTIYTNLLFVIMFSELLSIKKDKLIERKDNYE